jgi:hypothetical protein
MWWFLTFSCFCYLKIWLCVVESMLISDCLYLIFPVLSFFFCFHLLYAEFLVEYFVVVALWSYTVLISAYKKVLRNEKKTLKLFLSVFFFLSDNNVLKLEISRKRYSGNYTNIQTLHNLLLNDQWVIEEIRGQFKTPRIKWTYTYQNPWDTLKESQWGC